MGVQDVLNMFVLQALHVLEQGWVWFLDDSGVRYKASTLFI